MDNADRDGRDAAGIGPYAREREELTALSTMESWKVSDGEPDIRGWEVRTVSGKLLGSVADLLIDSKAGEVVLLDVDLPATDRHTFVPIRVVQIDRARRLVLMDSADLPEANIARDGRATTSGRRAADAGTVIYPRYEREVVVERPAIADSTVIRDERIDEPLPPPETSIASASILDSSIERRRADRRHIDRLSTDL